MYNNYFSFHKDMLFTKIMLASYTNTCNSMKQYMRSLSSDLYTYITCIPQKCKIAIV